MRTAVRLFAVCKERAKVDQITIDIAGDSATLAQLREAIALQAPALRPLVSMVRIAINEEFAREEDRIVEGDDIALIPPVSGGSGLGPFEIRRGSIDAREVIAAVSTKDAGAVVSFSGTVRAKTEGKEVLALEYEAYESMAAKVLRAIGDEISARWSETRTAILHRVGRLEVGEVSVAIAVSSPHRADAFDACRHAIERLKKDVPIWKKEVRRDGSTWVGIGS